MELFRKPKAGNQPTMKKKKNDPKQDTKKRAGIESLKAVRGSSKRHQEFDMDKFKEFFSPQAAQRSAMNRMEYVRLKENDQNIFERVCKSNKVH